VINDNLHENIMESLFLVAGQEREYITLPIGRALQVESLYLTSVAGYVPFDRRNTKLPGHSHGVFSPRAFKLINDKVKFFLEKLPMQDCPKKIYIRRNSGSRNVTNAKKFEELLVSQGYVIVEPEKLTFLQQAQLFSKAKSIVASSGAALANMIFASGSANIIIIIGKFSLTSYWYWQNIACASGKKISYVFGEAVDVKINGIHANFTIDLDSFIEVVGGKR
jgi:capsular polysaccharide biosynthesis protein